MATTEVKLKIQFSGSGYIDELRRISLGDQLFFPPFPQTELSSGSSVLYTSPPVDGENAAMKTTFPEQYSHSEASACSLKCRARFIKGGPEFFLKVVLNLDPERGDGMQFVAANDLKKEAEFYGEHLLPFQGDIVPRHYGLFMGNTLWGGGTIACVVLDYFHGLQWSRVMNTVLDTLENQALVADAASKLHDAGINHTQIGDDDEDHILYDTVTNTVKIVDFTGAAIGHHCSPFEDKPRQSAVTEKVCGDLERPFLILPLWYRERTLKFKRQKEAAKKDTSTQTNPEA